jgi:hypothetical protein
VEGQQRECLDRQPQDRQPYPANIHDPHPSQSISFSIGLADHTLTSG